jgi:serine/threonine protein phosphatase PrpC
VFAEPEIVTKPLTASYPFLVIASDGVFEFLPSQSVIDMVGIPECSSCVLTLAHAAIMAAGQQV